MNGRVFRGVGAFLGFFVGFTLVLLGPATAQEVPELVTDRPDQTESSATVPPGFLQLETGWTHVENDDEGEDFEGDGFPETLLRYGLCEGLELRVAMDGHVWEEVEFDDGSPDFDDEGWGDMQVGFKKYLWAENGPLPEAALLAHLSLPVGEDGFTSERVDPDFRFSFSHTLSETVSFGYNLGTAWSTQEDARGERDTGAVFQYTAALGFGLTDRLGAFVEFFGDIPMSFDGGPAHSFDGGFTYLISDNLQLDIASGVGLSDEADDWFIGAGFSYRWPK